MIKKCYHFLGSVKFALLLIGSLALFIAFGTFVESMSSSHQLAALLTYASTPFSLLLFGFFINILFSATRRYPFKQKHIPFLITHLGLLMILSGVILKNFYGIQGSLLLEEGKESDQLFFEESSALFIEDGKESFEIEMKSLQIKKKVEIVLSGTHHFIELTNFFPNGLEKLETFIKGDQLIIEGFPSLSLNNSQAKNPISIIANLHEDYKDFKIMAFQLLKDETVEQLAQELYQKNHLELEQNPLLLFIQDADKDFYIFIFEKEGLLVSQTFLQGDLEAFKAYDKGFFGYRAENVITLPKRKQTKVSYWISYLFPPIREKLKMGLKFITILEAANWPFVDKLKKEIEEEVFLLEEEQNERLFALLAKQIERIQEHLPAPPNYDKEFTLSIRLRTPLTFKHKTAQKNQKLENNRPLIYLNINGENLSLLFDRFGTGLKRTLENSRLKVRLQPKFEEIPYGLSLTEAKEVLYPNDQSTLSHEATLLIRDKKTNRVEETTISSSKVFETEKGYRFYLKNILGSSEKDVKENRLQLQIIVNYDPAKYYLTYPGSIILSLGIVLVFWPALLDKGIAYFLRFIKIRFRKNIKA